MKKKGLSTGQKKRTSPKRIRVAGFAALVSEVRDLVQSARQAAATAVNTLQVMTNFEIGRRIIEHEQKGAKRASYGTELLNVLSADLTREFGTGFSVTNLRLMRQFFADYSGRIHQTLSDESSPRRSIRQTAPDELANTMGHRSASVRPFTFDEDNYFLDLVFYNRLLRCYVLIDLKLDKLTHQDLGQMQMYVNYYDRHVRLPDEDPTVGLVLCKQKKSAVVELTLPKESNIHARQYQLYLPSKELLRSKLLEWAEQEAGL